MKSHGWATDHYETMNNSDIAELPVKDIMDKDSVCFMWATSPLLPEALEVMKAWWFKFKTVAFVWNKKHKSWTDVANMGRWTMGNVEMVLLWVRWKPKRIKNNIRQLVVAERTAHSAKPNEVRERIVELMWDLPRLELFCRDQADGWDALWDWIDGKDLRDSIPELINKTNEK